MPRVLGIDILSEDMALVASSLLHSQVALCIVGVLAGVLSLVSYFITTAAMENIGQRSHPHSSFRASEAMAIVIQTALNMLFPVMLIVVTRNAIRGNTRETFSCIVVFEGVCAVFSIFDAGSILYTSSFVFEQGVVLRSPDLPVACNEDPRACEEDRRRLAGVLTILAVSLLIKFTLKLCQTFAYLVGAFKARYAAVAISNGCFFTMCLDYNSSITHPPQVVMGKTCEPSVVADIESVQVGVPVAGLPVSGTWAPRT